MGSGNGKLGFKDKLILGIGEIPGTMTTSVVSVLFLIFLTDTVRLEPALAGLIFLIGRVWDAVNDPMMGILSDRTRTKWGRRRPYFLLASLPLALSFSLMFISFPAASQGLKMVLYTSFYLMFTTAITIYVTPYLCVLAEATDDYVERTAISNYRNLFSLVFGLTAVVVTPMLTKALPTPEQGFMTAGIGIGCFAALIALFMFRVVRERFVDRPGKYSGDFFRQIGEAFRNKAFTSMLVMYVGCLATVNIIEGTVLYYLKYWIQKPGQLEIVFVTVVLSSLATMPFWTFLSRRIGKKKAGFVALFLWLGVSLLWVLLDSKSPNYLLYLVAAANGLGYGGGRIMPWSMFPDTVDMDELQSGQRREGMYSGITTFFMKIGNSVSIFLFSLLLQAVGFVENQPQTGPALVLMRWVLFVVPLFFLSMSAIALAKYPITPARFAEMRKTLNERRAASKS